MDFEFLKSLFVPKPKRIKIGPSDKLKVNKKYPNPFQGAREMARRMRQMAAKKQKEDQNG